MKVEDKITAKTKGTRTGRFEQELHEIDVDKANEVELTVYDRNGDTVMPIGMLWIRISDIVEEMRRKKIESEFNSSGWATASQVKDGQIRPDVQFQPPPGQGGNHGFGPGSGPGQHQRQGQGVNPLPPPSGPIFITAWFAVEAVGRIQLTLGFRKSIRTCWVSLLIVNSQAKQK